MELGTAIFLSSIFLGIVALFIATKDRWNWKKILLRPLAIILVISILAGTGLYINSWLNDRPSKESKFWDITLGTSYEDVKFAKGTPTYEVDPDIWAYTTTDSDREWGGYVINFKDGRVRAIRYTGSRLYAPSIQGIGMYNDLDSVIEKFGQPSFVSKSKDELSRIYSFERFNIVAEVEKNQMKSIGIFDPSKGPLRYSNEASSAKNSNLKSKATK